MNVSYSVNPVICFCLLGGICIARAAGSCSALAITPSTGTGSRRCGSWCQQNERDCERKCYRGNHYSAHNSLPWVDGHAARKWRLLGSGRVLSSGNWPGWFLTPVSLVPGNGYPEHQQGAEQGRFTSRPCSRVLSMRGSACAGCRSPAQPRMQKKADRMRRGACVEEKRRKQKRVASTC